LLLLSFALLLSACASSAAAEPAPPTIHYGEDVCEFCGMIISDERYAAGYITADGQQHIFDDIGDMFQAQPANNQEVIAFFAHNYENNQWIRAEKATFVQSKGLRTPMASGLAAFESAEKAQAFAAEVQGEVMTFSEVSAYYKANLCRRWTTTKEWSTINERKSQNGDGSKYECRGTFCSA
jgi:copper chaperone NosL